MASVAVAAALVGALVVTKAEEPAAAAYRGAVASATMRTQAGVEIGTVVFHALDRGRTHVRARLVNVQPASEFHGFHVHTNGACEGDFTSAGGHWNPDGTLHGDHRGDMPVLLAADDGTAVADFTTDAFTVAQLLADEGGVAVIVHAGRDNYANVPDRYTSGSETGPDAGTEATGDAGARFGCGVVQPGAPRLGGGHWMVGRDGGIFTQGTAAFHGSSHGHTSAAVVDMEALPGNAGYYVAAEDGGVFTHGAARFEGSLADKPHNAPIVAMAAPQAHAKAVVRNQSGQRVGIVTFTQVGSSVRIVARVGALPPTSDFHGFHIHANGVCEGDFTSAGGHWNPAQSNHGTHAGDLPALYAGANGVATATVLRHGITVNQLLEDAGGVSVIVHAGRDNYANIPARYSTATGNGPDATTNATGDAGGRAACGVVEATGGSTRAGYWLATADGGVFAFGDAPFHGSMGGTRLVDRIVAIASTPTGDGYWLAGADGGVFAFGDAPFHGSLGGTPFARPVVGIEATPTGDGYILIARDGGVFTFGDATFHGSMGGRPLNRAVNGGAMTPSGQGYWLFAADGGVFDFGDAEFVGSMAGTPLVRPIVTGAAVT